MLYEVRATKPYDGPWRQRWFTSDDFDLTIWMTEERRPVGFQLCYDKRRSESALEWHERRGYMHYQVHERRRCTPLLLPGGTWPGARVCQAFEASAQAIEAGIRVFVQERLMSAGWLGQPPRIQ